MRSCATRSANLKGPAQTGLRPKSRPAASAALGDTTMPARSVSTAMNGENGCFSTTRTVSGSTTSTRSMAPISLRRKLPCRPAWRSSVYSTAAASIGSPSWNTTPGRRRISSVVGSTHSKPVASTGTICCFASKSNSLSQIAVITSVPT